MEECWDTDGTTYVAYVQQTEQSAYYSPDNQYNNSSNQYNEYVQDERQQYSSENSYGNNSGSGRPRQNDRTFSSRGRNTFSRDGNDRNSRSNEESLEIQIDSSYVGRVIGRGGSKIQELQDESGAQIKILKESESNGCTSVKLTGSSDAREKAREMIEELTNDVGRMSKSKSSYGYNSGSQNYTNATFSGGNSAGWQNDSTNGEGNTFNDESLDIQIDSSYVGKVIGRGGSKIQELQEESGAQIKILRESEANGCTSIKLTGSTEARERAKTLIEELTTDSSRMSTNRSDYGYNGGSQNDTNVNFYGGNNSGWQNESPREEARYQRNISNEESLEIRINSSYIGKVIGRGGSKIQELQEESGAQIKIVQESESDGCTSVKLTGSAQACEKAKTMIEELTTDFGRMSTNRSNYGCNNTDSQSSVQENYHTGYQNNSANIEDSDEMVIKIESNYIGRIIGRGGSKIQELQDESGAQIKILKESEADGCTSVKLTGSAEAREAAKTMIEELASDGGRMSINRSNYGFNNSGLQNNSNVNSYGSNSGNWRNDSANQDAPNRINISNGETSVIQIDSTYVGRVIGRGGSKIQELQDESGAQIKILKDSEADGCTSVKLTGSDEAREKAKVMIEELTTDVGRMSSNRSNYGFNSAGSQNNTYGDNSSGWPNDSADGPVPDGINTFIDWDALKVQSDEARKRKLAALPPLKKDFYREDPAVAAMSKAEVQAFWAANNNISVINVEENDNKPIPNPVSTFHQAFQDYPELLTELSKQGFQKPSPIQCQAWPIILSGHDMIGIAQTGTGKTIAFLFPALVHIVGQITPREKRIGPSVVIMAPTRELAQQIEVEAKKYKYRGITSVCIYGGGSRRNQVNVVTKGVDIIIATPGRLNDLVMNKIVDVSGVTYLVLDEADRMLDLGFEPQIRKIVMDIRPDRQTIMTSATWTSEIQDLSERYLTKPFKVNVGALDLAAVHTVTQEIVFADDEDRRDILNDFLASMGPEDKVIVFVERKAVADDLSSDLLLRGVECQSIHGDREQCDREQALDDLKTGYVRILIATDVASRGLDIKDITHIFNMYFPRNIEEYVHRVGRTGRAGRTGTAISIFTRQDWMHAENFIKILEEAEQEVPEELYKMADRYRAWKQKKMAEDAQGRGMRRGGGGGGGGRRRF
ncbi:hypothetical protein JTE90_001478 [Oedothorax gibbosus]|uniref:RNA helicase n=1 Tax=Oedothorax gibbosus TaxID=931172 RepID=A0AAV6UDK0_9ARAC|nr:hypothetical protein JTE90_001478 [Oedothorax gibbosus]